MTSFTNPVNANEVPGLTADTRGPARRMFRWSGGNPRSRNFYIVDGTTFTEVDPTASYNADGSVNQTGLERTTRAFVGSGPHSVTSAEATIITDAGYGDYLS